MRSCRRGSRLDTEPIATRIRTERNAPLTQLWLQLRLADDTRAHLRPRPRPRAGTALAALGVAGCGGSDDEAVGADSIAVVDGTEISKAEFDEYIARSKKQAEIEKREFPKVGTAEYKSVQNNIVTYLVRRTENEKEAAALGIVVTDAEIEKRLDQVKAQFGGEDKFQQAVKQQGLTLDQVRDDISGQLLSQKLVDKLTKDVKVADADVKKYYEEQQVAVPASPRAARCATSS